MLLKIILKMGFLFRKWTLNPYLKIHLEFDFAYFGKVEDHKILDNFYFWTIS